MKKLDQSIGDDFFFNIGLKSNGAIVCLFVCLVYSKGAQLQLTGIFCYIGYIQTNLYIIQFHNHTWQRVLARKGARGPVEEWSEAHLMGGHFRNSLFSDLVFPADASTAVVYPLS